jgi:hypothetical protein
MELRDRVKMKSKYNVSKKVETGDITTSKWVLERRDNEYNPTNKHDHTTDGKQLNNVVSIGMPLQDNKD